MGEGFPHWELARMGAWGSPVPGSPLHRKRDSFAPPCYGLPAFLLSIVSCQRAAWRIVYDDMMSRE